MKRSIPLDFHDRNEITMIKKIKQPPRPSSTATATSVASVLMDENLLFEVLKHVDARTLGAAACVNRRWNQTAQDERLWELICTRHWPEIGCGSDQLRIVVLALGGFRCLHSHYLLPLSKPSVSVATLSSSSTVVAATSSSVWPCLPAPRRTATPTKPAAATKTRWEKDEIQLSLSLLSIRFFEKLNCNNMNK
ncbi:hypothetical protein L1987_23084 [Smallanthus sonchifolius]|uniref:Uncharacterized protein n=1 Tax=Smallanthus sonchifolius TaxID=185202 RepID=A0ACB9II46_9ASTR|nr:hypothetical protein L1987_23084 [Smallanthus sonchifolius]